VKLTPKIMFCITPFLLLLMIMAGYGYWTAECNKKKSNEANNVVDIAGRQRMLSQKITKDALIYAAIRTGEENAKRAVKVVKAIRKHMSETINAVKSEENATKGGFSLTEESMGFTPARAGKAVSDEISNERFVVRQTSLKYRNPENEPDAFEAKVLKRFENGEITGQYMESWKNNGKTYVRVMTPLYITKACMSCHSSPDKVPALIKEMFPGDLATGYKIGDVRGAISVKMLAIGADPEEEKHALLLAIDLFDKSLEALQNGGNVSYGKNTVFIKTIKSKQIDEKLNDVKLVWMPFKEALKKLVSVKSDTSEFLSLRDYIIENNVKLLEVNKRAVNSIVKEANNAREKTSAKSNFVFQLICFLGGVVTSAVFFLLIKHIVVKPVQLLDLKEMADGIALGDLNQKIRISRSDEIGELAESFRHMVAKQLEKLALAENIADKDLTANINLASEKDSLGLALQVMTKNLRGIISQISDTANQILSGSSQVASFSQSLSDGATEQAASIEEISSSMAEMASQTKANAENAVEGNKLAITARDSGEKGKKQMHEMLYSMDEINKSSKQISKIIKVIDDIAFQTNLLALNAAVEAARAGKHGKGFSVVAEEVRNLAGRSAKAAKETSELIEGSVKNIENGAKIAGRTAEVLDEIANSSVKVADIVGEIAAASNEQSQGISQINSGLTQIEQVIQQNTASAEETSSASEELSSQAVQLRKILSQFKTQEDSNATALLEDETALHRGVSTEQN